MNNPKFIAQTMATTSAAFVAMSGCYLDVDALIASERAKAEKFAANKSGVVVRLQTTTAKPIFFESLTNSVYFSIDSYPLTKVRNVSRIEDLILRKAALSAGRMISRGRFVSK